MTVVLFDQPYLDDASNVHTIIPPPYPFEVSIAGRTYEIDTSFEPYRRDAFRHRSVPPQRESINIDNIAGEGTINPGGLWRRGAVDWSLGAGQLYQDRKGGLSNRFYRSKGVNPWTQYQLTLLQATKQVMVLGEQETLVKAIAVSNYVYIVRAGSLQWTTDWSHFTNVGGLPVDGSLTDICTDGLNVYVSAGNSHGIYTTTQGALLATNFVTGTSFDSCGYCNDRLMAGSGPKLYNITHGAQTISLAVALTATDAYTSVTVSPLPQAVASGDTITVGTDSTTASDASAIGDTVIYVASFTAGSSWAVGTAVTDTAWASNVVLVFEHNNPAWHWTCYAGGSQQIYIGGLSSTGGFQESVNGGASGVYRSTIDADGTTLAAPVIALPLEGGEFVSSLATYLNLIFVGSNLGVRMCETLNANDPTGASGDLRAGGLIPNIVQPVNLPVYGIVGSGRFVYFSWPNYDADSTGIGRMDLTTFIDALAPAYASDLMCPGSGVSRLDWDPINNGPLICVQGNPGTTIGGVYVIDNANKVASGTVQSGGIEFDLAEDKVAISLQANMVSPLNGSVYGFMAVDQPVGQNYSPVGQTFQTRPGLPWALDQLRGQIFDVEIQLNSGGANLSPTLARWTLKALPGVATGILISVVLILPTRGEEKGLAQPFSPYQEYAFLENLRQNQQVITYVEGPFMKNGIIQQLDWLPNLQQAGGANSGFNANLIVYILTLPE